MSEAYGVLPHTLPLEFRGSEYDKKRFDLAVMIYASSEAAWHQYEAMQKK